MNIYTNNILFLLYFQIFLHLGLCYNNSSIEKQIVNSTFYELLQYKLSTCIIAKNFSSMITSIFCYLFMEEKFKLKYKHLADFNWRFSDCVSRIKYKSLEKLIKNSNYNNDIKFYNEWVLLLIIRNPIERFISGYVDKCTLPKRLKKPSKMCLYCVSNIKCFINRLYNKLNSSIRIKKSTYNGVKKHFYPQTLQCNYYKYKKKFKILKYENNKLNNFYSQLKNVLEDRNVSKSHIDFIDMEIRNYKIHHATSGRKITTEIASYLYNDVNLMKKLVNIYYNDFIKWNFKYPKIL